MAQGESPRNPMSWKAQVEFRGRGRFYHRVGRLAKLLVHWNPPLSGDPSGLQEVASSTARHLPGHKTEAKAIGLEGHGTVCHKPPPRN